MQLKIENNLFERSYINVALTHTHIAIIAILRLIKTFGKGEHKHAKKSALGLILKP